MSGATPALCPVQAPLSIPGYCLAFKPRPTSFVILMSSGDGTEQECGSEVLTSPEWGYTDSMPCASATLSSGLLHFINAMPYALCHVDVIKGGHGARIVTSPEVSLNAILWCIFGVQGGPFEITGATPKLLHKKVLKHDALP